MRTEPKGGSASHSVVSPWTVARQAPLSTGFSRKNTRVGSHFLLQEIWFQSLGQEDLLEKEMATLSSILPGESRGQRSHCPWGHD